jgi:hypothetical protein
MGNLLTNPKPLEPIEYIDVDTIVQTSIATAEAIRK